MKQRIFPVIVLLLVSAIHASALDRHHVFGIVLKVSSPKTFVVSCKEIPGYMEAMVMSFTVREAKELDALRPGMMVDFTLVEDEGSSYAENVTIHKYQSTEQEPQEVERLKLFQGLTAPHASDDLIAVNQHVPDFTLVDQNRQTVQLSQFAGKVVVISFFYTKCPYSNYCFRLSNNLGVVRQRFADRLGKDLVLLSVTFDPVFDRPEVLAKYAGTWKTGPTGWYFLTGQPAEIRRVCGMFGTNVWNDEGLLSHTMHTVVINRNGDLVSNLEGNEFTAEQLGNFLQTVMEN